MLAVAGTVHARATDACWFSIWLHDVGAIGARSTVSWICLARRRLIHQCSGDFIKGFVSITILRFAIFWTLILSASKTNEKCHNSCSSQTYSMVEVISALNC